MNLNIPRKCGQVLWDKQCRRYRILFGGRGSAKSWSVARYLITRAATEKLRIVCTREIQNSIKDSVYRLLCDQIHEMKLDAYFNIKSDMIVSATGAEFIFKGLQKNINEIKSMEGIDICWVEEAERVVENSWVNLIPTVRKEGSFFIIVFNPEDERSSTYTRFVEKDRIPVNNPDMVRGLVNYWDNPFFPEVLRKEMEWDKKNDIEKWEHVWSGSPKKYGNAVIFKNKIRVEEFEAPEGVQFFYGADFGYAADPSCLVRMYIIDRLLYIDYEAYGFGIEIDDLHAFFKQVPDSHKWKITADSARPETISHLSRNTRDGLHEGYNIVGAEKGKGSVEDGIEFLKNFEAIVIHPRCTGSIDNFNNYRWKTDKVTNEILPIPLDKSNHICFHGKTKILMSNMKQRNIKDIVIGDEVITNNGIKKVTDSWMTSKEAEVKRYIFSNGKELIATKDHPVYTNRGIVPLDAIRYDDIIETWNISHSTSKNIDGIESITRPLEAVQREENGCMSQYGNTHVLFCYLYYLFIVLLKNTYQDTQNKICKMQNTNKRTKNSSMQSGHYQKNGMNHQKEIDGIKNTVRELLVTGNQNNIHVYYVADNSKAKQSRNSAQTHVRQNIEGNQEQTTSLKNALYAAKIMNQINTQGSGHVRLVAVQNLSQKIEVYNLTIEDTHNYYANGFLVSNCDACRYGLEAWIKEQIIFIGDVL